MLQQDLERVRRKLSREGFLNGDADYDVDVAPHDYRDGKDPQMEKALELVLASLREHPVTMPSFDGRPNLAPPKLPPRK